MTTKLDLHGQDRIGAKIKLNHFINGHYDNGTYRVEVVFGIGTGALKQEVDKFLKSRKKIEKFEHPIMVHPNLGAYFIYLKKRVK